MLYKQTYEGNDNHLYIPHIYSHGNLMEIMGHDMLETDDIKLYNKINFRSHSNDRFTYITNAFVTEEVQPLVKCFLWKSKIFNRYIGLVCNLYDSESIKDAELKFNKREEHI